MAAGQRRPDETYEQYRKRLKIEGKWEKVMNRSGVKVKVKPRTTPKNDKRQRRLERRRAQKALVRNVAAESHTTTEPTPEESTEG